MRWRGIEGWAWSKPSKSHSAPKEIPHAVDAVGVVGCRAGKRCSSGTQAGAAEGQAAEARRRDGWGAWVSPAVGLAFVCCAAGAGPL